MLAIYGIALREKTLESIMGRKQKHSPDEFVGLVRSFPRAHWFFEVASLAGAGLIFKCRPSNNTTAWQIN